MTKEFPDASELAGVYGGPRPRVGREWSDWAKERVRLSETLAYAALIAEGRTPEWALAYLAARARIAKHE